MSTLKGSPIGMGMTMRRRSILDRVGISRVCPHSSKRQCGRVRFIRSGAPSPGTGDRCQRYQACANAAV